MFGIFFGDSVYTVYWVLYSLCAGCRIYS